LSGREGFEFLYPSSFVGFGAFREMKRLFFTTPETDIFSKSSWIETEVNKCHRGDRTLNRTWSWHNRTRPVSDSSSLACGLGFTTGVSGHSWDQRVRSGSRGTANVKGRSNTVTSPVTIDRTYPVVWWSLLESTGHWHCGVRSVQVAHPVVWSAMQISGDRTPRRVRSVLIGAFGHSSV
jgi:hypothetical protein